MRWSSKGEWGIYDWNLAILQANKDDVNWRPRPRGGLDWRAYGTDDLDSPGGLKSPDRLISEKLVVTYDDSRHVAHAPVPPHGSGLQYLSWVSEGKIVYLGIVSWLAVGGEPDGSGVIRHVVGSSGRR